MASGVNDNLAEGFFKVTVNPWGQGKGDDCLWNIAVGVLAREGNDNPTVQEINDTIEAIKENNNKADGYHIREDNIIYAKQEILVPLEDAIAGIKEKVNTLTSEYNTLKSQYDSYCDELSGINLNVYFKKQAYDEAYEAYSKYPSGANIQAKTNAEEVMNSAKKDYETALEALEAHKQKIDDTSALLGEKNNEINAFKEDLEVYIDDYDDSKETLDEQLKEVAGYITEIDDETDGLLKELNDLYNELNEFGNDAPNPESNDEYAKAQEYLSNGVQDGVLESNDKTAQTTYPDEFASDSALTSYVIDKNTGKNRDYVNDTSMSADGKKYTITFNDGRKITYTKDEETGKWVANNAASSTSDTKQTEKTTPEEESEDLYNKLNKKELTDTDIINYLANDQNVNSDNLNDIFVGLNDDGAKDKLTEIVNGLLYKDEDELTKNEETVLEKFAKEIENNSESETSKALKNDSKQNGKGLTYAQKWEQYNCVRLVQNDSDFQKFLDGANTGMNSESINDAKDPDYFDDVNEQYDLYTEYKKYCENYSELIVMMANTYRETGQAESGKEYDTISNNYPQYSVYRNRIVTESDKYNSEILDGTQNNAKNFVDMCKEWVDFINENGTDEQRDKLSEFGLI